MALANNHRHWYIFEEDEQDPFVERARKLEEGLLRYCMSNKHDLETQSLKLSNNKGKFFQLFL